MQGNRLTEAHSPTGDSRGRDLSGHTRKPTEAHSPTGDSRGRDLSGHTRKPTNRGALTSWRRQREGLVRTRKETDRPRHTHILETAEEGLVGTHKETDRPRRTHQLEAVEGGTFQDMQGNRSTEAHSPTGDGRGSDLSGHTTNPTDRGALTNWRRQRERLVKTRNETDRLRHTHKLETAEGATCQDTQQNRPTETHSPTGDRGRDLSGHATKPTDRGALTSWGRQREGLVRTHKETNRPRCTHSLETAEGGTC